MKRILIFACLICSDVAALADMISEERTVETLISAAHDDQLYRFLETTDLARIAAHPKHGLQPQALCDLLKKIPRGEHKFEVSYHAETKTTLVRLLSPVRLDFTLESRAADKTDPEDKFVVVSVTP